MRTMILAGAILAIMTSAAMAGGSYDPKPPATTINNHVSQWQSQWQAQSQSQSQKAYGGAGGNGGAGGAGGNGYGGSASATGGAASSSATGGDASNGGQQVSVNTPQQTPTIAVAGIALAGLASSDCVLSKTDSAFFGLGIPAFDATAGFARGTTSPYVECNIRAAIPIVANIQGTIDGVDTRVIVANMVKSLSGVQSAIDQAKGVTPAQQSSTSATPAAIAPQQTASNAPVCLASLPAVQMMRCQAGD